MQGQPRFSQSFLFAYFPKIFPVGPFYKSRGHNVPPYVTTCETKPAVAK